MKRLTAVALSSALSGLFATAGPFAVAAEAGSEGSPRRLETRPETVKVEGIPPERVRLSVSVLDRAGHPVKGLVATDFWVKEDGVIQTLVDFGMEAGREDRPLSAVFLIDRSGSMGNQMYRWKDACVALLSVLRPIDEVQVSIFDSDVEILQPFTSKPEELAAAVGGIDRWGSGGTRFLHALDESISSMRSRRGRKVVFLLTDGLEDGITTANVVTNSAVRGVAQRAVQSQTTIVTVLSGKTIHRPWLAAQDLAVHTGGWWLYSGDDPASIVKSLGERLLQSYYLAYDSPRKPGDQSKRRVEVEIMEADVKGAVVSTVAGVYGDAPLLEHLLEDLQEDDASVRAAAAASLGVTTEKEVRKPLVEALEDESPQVRGAAAISLAERGDLNAVGRIGRLLNDADPDVRASAVRALGIMLQKAPDEKTRDRILETLESLDPGE